MRFVFIWIAKEFFDLNKFLCSFILFDVIFFNSVSQTLRRFFVWYALHMFFHSLKKNLMKALFEKTTFFLSSADNLACIICVHLIFRSIDVFFALLRRRSHVSDNRCLICRQKFSIRSSCLCSFMRCLKNICSRIICNWMSCTCVSVSRICIETVLKLSQIKRKLYCCSLINFFVVTTTLFERSCDACQIVES
jgi:hypothetical protein